MSQDIIYLTLEQVLFIHDDQIEKYGGAFGLRDLKLLESAVFRPQTTFSGNDLYPTIYDKVSSLMHSIILNHPFVDGNKRTGVVAGLVFLAINKYYLNITNQTLISIALKIENKKWNVQKLSTFLNKHSKKI